MKIEMLTTIRAAGVIAPMIGMVQRLRNAPEATALRLGQRGLTDRERPNGMP